ncbi:MAG: hypothetical protein ACTHLO_16575 [Pseudolabrys sp.]
MALIERPAQGVVYRERTGPPVSNRTLVAAGAALLGVGLAGALMRRKRAPLPRRKADPYRACAQGLSGGAAMLAASVVADSAMEHFRGNYDNRAMVLAPLVATATMATALAGRTPKSVSNAVFGTALAVGTAGLGFHLYNITKWPGGLSWQTIFYAAPFAAPGALALAGVLGLAAARLPRARYAAPDTQRKVATGLAWSVSASLMVTASEVWLLHFRGAFHDPFMYVPVTLVPAAALSLAHSGAKPTARNLKVTRSLLKLTALVGLAGAGFHAYGVSRNMGGFRNWSQNLFSGPPLPAPPSFTGLAFAGLGTLTLLGARGGADV